MSRALGRRDLLKLGAGAVIAATASEHVSSQEGRGGSDRPPAAPGSPRPPGELRPHTGPGYKNDYNRLGGNGPMDDTTRKIVTFVLEFSEAHLTPSVTTAINRTMVDSMAALVTGFEGAASRVAAKLARLSARRSEVHGPGVRDLDDAGAGGIRQWLPDSQHRLQRQRSRRTQQRSDRRSACRRRGAALERR
jgi:hypothetical protein